MEEKKAVLFDIGRFRNTDGPGIRTILFFKGCPLRCKWCSNAFGLSPRPQLAVNPARCIACGKCVHVCPAGVNSLEQGKLAVDFSKCTLCGRCIQPCPQDTRMITGKEYTAKELFEEACKDAAFYRKDGGGVTLSGGEVLVYYEVAAEVLKRCRKNYMNTCIETSAYGEWEHLLEIAKWCNTIFVDIKHMDSQRHREITGVPNERILSNITRLDRLALEKGIRLIIRRPIIPGYNDEDENTIRTAEFAAHLKLKPEINLLPYHNLGENKYAMIGEKYSVDPGMGILAKTDPVTARVKELTQSYAPGNRVSVGGEAIEI